MKKLNWYDITETGKIVDYEKEEMEREEQKMLTWAKWEDQQVDKYGFEVFIILVENPIPWMGKESRRYNIYSENTENHKDSEKIDIIIDCELIETENGFKIIEY